ncbi:YvcK family protein [Natroniella sulfidigena]|uniref:gluconeogenesis factor YvcK family protein n=1 Tax=Natroniella sulfidigena TaxID=723921 RepID=UPI00200A57E1|nr:YvcK family protein [Natroniella sulfidigena]MCK8817190.1 YvcK family protein [Natroniella sulfidigena]
MKEFKWFYPGLKFKRWLFVIAIGIVLVGVGVAVVVSFQALSLVESLVIEFLGDLVGDLADLVHRTIGISLILGGVLVVLFGTRKMIDSILEAVVPESEDNLVELLYQKRYLKKGPKIVVVGGGTGLSTMLRGIKKFTNNITAIVTVADDGGSSGALREQLGILPPGDIRNCLVALADTEPLMEKLFQYRFNKGDELKGHSFGNLFIATMSEVLGDFEEGVKESSKVLAIKGQVLPSTLEDLRLSAKLKDGKIISGESQIPKVKGEIEKVFIEPADSEPLPEALTAIEDADLIVLGPGSLYTSILPNLLVKKLTTAIKKADASKLYVCNVMTQPGETDHYTASDHLQALYDHVGDQIVDYVLANSEEVDRKLIKKYAQEGAEPVKADLAKLKEQGVKVIHEPVINQSNLVRHNPDKLARVIMDLVIEEKNNYF